MPTSYYEMADISYFTLINRRMMMLCDNHNSVWGDVLSYYYLHLSYQHLHIEEITLHRFIFTSNSCLTF